MANPSKSKGDHHEREAVGILLLMAADLAVDNPMRELGAGRSDDRGDIRVLPHVAIQVRAFKASQLSSAVRTAAIDAVRQAGNARVDLSLGMAPIPRRPVGDPESVRWVASTMIGNWPLPISRVVDGVAPSTSVVPVWEFGSSGKLIDWLQMKPTSARPDVLPIEERVAVLSHGTSDEIVVGTLQAWVAAYRLWLADRTDGTNHVLEASL